MKKKISLLIRDEGGAISAMTVIMMVAFVGIMALVIDLGHLHTVQNELRNAGDASALRGARAFYDDNEAALTENSVTRGSAGIPQAEALATVKMNYTDTKQTYLEKLQNVAIGVWYYNPPSGKPGWFQGGTSVGKTPNFTLWDPVNNKELYGKIIGPGIRLNVNREGVENYGPVGMSLASIFKPSVDVVTEATAALSPVGTVTQKDYENFGGTPPPLRIGDKEFLDPKIDRIFTLYPNNTQSGGWHSFDYKNPNVPLLENLVWGKNQKTGETVIIPELTPGEDTINLQNGVDAKMFMVPDPTKPNDPNQLSLLSRWLYETGRTVIDPKVPTYSDPPLVNGEPKQWFVLLPVTDSDQATGASTVLGFARVAIDWVSPPPDKTISIRILEPYVAPPGIPGGGAFFGVMAIDPKLVPSWVE